MAITVATNPNESIEDAPHYFFGLSSDTKPTVASHNGLPKPTPGSGFLETDTFDIYQTADGTTWTIQGTQRTGHNTRSIGVGVKTVTTVGTDEVLAASQECTWLICQAQTDNTNKVAVGNAGVDATVATGNGVILDPGDAITLLTDNLADVYVDALVAGEGVRYTYGKRIA